MDKPAHGDRRLQRNKKELNKTMERLVSASKFSKSEEAQFRLRVIEFSKKYGVKAAQDAFSISRSTIFRWRRCLKESEGRLDSLIP